MESIIDSIGWSGVAIAVMIAIAIVAIQFRRQIKVAVHWLMEAIGAMWFATMWIFPILLLLIGWLYPDLHAQVTRSTPSGPVLQAALLPAAIGLGWLGFQFLTAQSGSTSFRMLKADLAVSVVWALVCTNFVTVKYMQSDLQYWHLLPTLFTVPEALLNVFVALTNAYQKNPTQIRRE